MDVPTPRPDAAASPDALPAPASPGEQRDPAAPTDQVRRLIGIGVGPGDPELVTLKAVRALAGADAILVPETETSSTRGPGSADGRGGAGRAELIVLGCCPTAAPAIRRVPFSMADRSGVTDRRREAWDASAAAALTAYDEGARTVAFATVGDPSVYSTFSYLAATVSERLPDVVVEVIPGITAMQALAAASRIPLVEGTEVLALVPVTAGLETLERAMAAADTVVAYKGGRRMPEVVSRLRAADREATTVIGTDVSLPHQRLVGLAELGEAERAPYFCTVLSAPARATIGGRL
ncbi:MAG: precorrin-2 C(20)-methyltransferase [Austwickia sp.]|nr:precorrin-2 C(20)-methyltransferase [Austwickia sp.]